MKRDREWLVDIFESVQLVAEYVKDVSHDEFLGDVQLQDSVIRRIRVIGEAAGHISREFCDTHTEIPWSEITGMRHQVIHGYGTVDIEIVWRTSTADIPTLIQKINQALSDFS